MRILSGLALLLALTIASSAQAQSFPTGSPCLQAGVRHQCYDLENYRLLLQFNEELTLSRQRVSLLTERLEIAQRVSTSLQRAVDAQETQISTLSQERDRLFERWQEENRLRHEAENMPDFMSWLGWGIAAAAVAALLGMILAASLG